MVTKYIDFNRGSDSNDGSTPELAWKHLTKIDDAAYTAGDSFLLADDSVWEYDLATRVLPPTTWTGTRFDPVVIGKYSPLSANTGLPIIRRNRRLLESDWTYDAPNNCWYYDAPFNVGDYCMVRAAGTWMPSRTGAASGSAGLPLDSVDGRYHIGVGGTEKRFYMYAPAGTNPTAYYGEVLLGITGGGFFTISNQRGFVRVQDIRFEEMGTGVSGYSDTAFDVGIQAYRLQGRTVSTLVSAVTTGASGQLYADIRHLDVEDWGSTATWTFTAAGAGMKSLEIAHCNIRDGMHNYSQGAIYHQARTTGVRPQIHDNVFSGARWGTRDKDADGCAIYCETGSDLADVYRNRVSDSYMAFQDNSGRSNRWFSNVATNCKSFMKVSDDVEHATIDIDVFNNTAVVGADIAPTFGSDTGTGIRCILATGGTAIKFRNNVIVNVGAAVESAILTPSTVITTRDFSNNAIHGYTYVAKREYTPFSVETAANSVTASPLLAADGCPLPGSPIVGAGAHLGYTRDVRSIQRQNPPNIGAFDRATLRPT